MADFLFDIDDATLIVLERRAASRGIEVEELAREILTESVLGENNQARRAKPIKS